MKNTIAISGIWLRPRLPSKDEKYGRVEVLVEVDGKWRVVCSEQLMDGDKTIISHIAESGGIKNSELDTVTV